VCLSVNTVKTHLAGIYRELGAGARKEVVRRARELGPRQASRNLAHIRAAAFALVHPFRMKRLWSSRVILTPWPGCDRSPDPTAD
jgi:hypothetical protein